MANGKFASSVYTGAGTGYYRYIEVVWSSKNDTNNNQSTITWEAYSRSPDSDTTTWVMAKNIVVTINGTATTIVGSTETELYKDDKIGGGSITVKHGSNGKKSINVSITAQIYVYGETNSSYSGTITMSPNPVYTLSISSGTGSNISVNRTFCAGSGGTGKISAGTKKLYYGDKLKITFTPSSNYAIDTHKVNGVTFASGNTHAVSGNVTILSTAIPLKSAIGATDSNIGSNSIITIKRYNSEHTHTITYAFGNKTGTIVANSSDTLIPWTIPTEFYTQIPNARKGTCTLTCETFKGGTSLGSTTCSIAVTVVSDECQPAITATVKDTNTITKALTGDDSTLIRYKSTALCTLNATPKNYATISSMSIEGSLITGDTNENVTTATKSYHSVSTTSFRFIAKDSREYITEVTKTPIMIAYINLSCNPILSRPTPTGSSIVMTFSGDIFRGSFGACSNTLTLQYRYKESGGSYGSWKTIESSDIVFGTNTYHSGSAISVGNDFDYLKDYEFQIKATDGGVVDNTAYTLSTVTKTIPVKQGVPVCDWGKSDFNFNVPVKMPPDAHKSAGAGLNMNNSDVVGCNGIYFADSGNANGEGLFFPNTDTNGLYDCLYANGGNLYFIPGYPTNQTSYKIFITPGDVYAISTNTPFAAFLANNSKGIYFTIPLNKPIIASNVAFSGNVALRGLNGAVLNPTTNSAVLDLANAAEEGFTITYAIKGSVITVLLTLTQAVSQTTHTVISVATIGDFKMTFS